MSSSTWFNHVEIPLRQPSTFSEGTAEIFKRPLIKHKWTFEQKLTLSILVRWYSNNWHEKTRIFNAYFEGARLPELVNRSFSENVLRAMWHDIDHKRHTNSTLQTIWHNTALTTSPSEWGVSRTALEDRAVELGLSLQKKTPPNDSDTRELLGSQEASRLQRGTKRKRYIRPPRGSSLDNENGLYHIPFHQLHLHSAVQTPTKINSRQSGVQLLTPPSSSQRLNQTIRSLAKCLPRFLFRAFNKSSQGLNSPEGLRAGRFKESLIIPPPPDTQTHTYRDDALRHINAVPNGLTPFISVTRNLLRALHHGFKMTSDFSIAVIESRKIGTLDLDEKRGFFTRIQPVRDLHLDSPDGYNGSGEYLVWGEIPRNAIISCRTISQILSNVLNEGNGGPFYFDTIRSAQYSTTARNKIKQARTPLTTQNGKAVGSLLQALQIPETHVEDAVYSVITDFGFQASRSGMWRKNHDFMQGVRRGFNKAAIETTLPESQNKVLWEEIGISGNESGDPSDDDLTFVDINNEQPNSEFKKPAENMKSKRETMCCTAFGDVRIKGEVSGIDAAEATMSEDDTAIDRPKDPQLWNTYPRDPMTESIFDEEHWEQSFIHDLEDVIGMKKPKIER